MGDDNDDVDGDGAPTACDVCPDDPDPLQVDGDLDGYGIACDCNDLNDNVYPGGAELCDNRDNDCNGLIDDNPVDGRTWYLDLDGDSDGSPTETVNACQPPPGYVAESTDCDDTDPHVRGNTNEVCDGIDNDCDGEIDEIECAIPDPSDDTGKGGDTGCGCTATPAGGSAGWLALFALAGLRRRR